MFVADDQFLFVISRTRAPVCYHHLHLEKQFAVIFLLGSTNKVELEPD